VDRGYKLSTKYSIDSNEAKLIAVAFTRLGQLTFEPTVTPLNVVQAGKSTLTTSISHGQVSLSIEASF
jgi:hypothetical protein